jgi:hypothetical protein
MLHGWRHCGLRVLGDLGSLQVEDADYCRSSALRRYRIQHSMCKGCGHQEQHTGLLLCHMSCLFRVCIILTLDISH